MILHVFAAAGAITGHPDAAMACSADAIAIVYNCCNTFQHNIGVQCAGIDVLGNMSAHASPDLTYEQRASAILCICTLLCRCPAEARVLQHAVAALAKIDEASIVTPMAQCHVLHVLIASLSKCTELPNAVLLHLLVLLRAYSRYDPAAVATSGAIPVILRILRAYYSSTTPLAAANDEIASLSDMTISLLYDVSEHS